MIPRSKSNLSKIIAKSKDSLDDLEPDLVKLDLSRKNIKEFPMNNQLVKSLNASSNKLTQLNGQMVAALLSYQRLKILDLSNNFLTEFPDELKDLQNLEVLKLFYNHFRNNDKIKSIFLLPNLKTLDFSQNKLTSLPEKFPPKLEVLTLDFNMVKKFENVSIPNLTRLSLALTQLEYISPDLSFQKLTYLDLSRNNLVSLPDLTKFSPNLEILNLSNNFFPELPAPPLSIREYIIKFNYIIELPQNLSTYVNLKSLDVSHNLIEFIPALPPSIISFVFSSNRVNTTTPCKTPHLQRLYLRNNNLTVYPQYDKLQIKEYSGGFNNITVIRPLSFSEFISRIDFTDNQITEIPSFVYKLPNLNILVVSKNKIRTISNDIFKLKRLQNLNLTENPIEILPPLPISLKNCYAGYCNLKILPDMKKNVNLNILALPGNNLAEYPNAPNLKTLILSRNRFINFPSLQFIEKSLSKIEDLDLSFNFIRQIPSNLKMNHLEELDLSFNSIKSFPDDFKLPKLQFLKIGSNPISLNQGRKVTNRPADGQKRIPPRSNSSNEINMALNLNKDSKQSLLNSISLENLNGLSSNHNFNDSKKRNIQLSSSSQSHLPSVFNSDHLNSKPSESLLVSNNSESKSSPPKSILASNNSETESAASNSLLKEINSAHIQTESHEAVLNTVSSPTSTESSLKSPNSKPHNTSVKITRPNITQSSSSASLPHQVLQQSKPSHNSDSLDAEKFNNLQICDITNTGIVFDKEPHIRQFFVSRRLPQYKSRHVKILSSLSWLSFSEMKGVRETMEDSISLNAFINGDVDMYVICDGHSGYQTSAFSCLYLVDYLSTHSNLQKLSRMTLYNSINSLNYSLNKCQFPDGSTMAMALFNGRKLIAANIGDSRVIVTTKDGKVSFETIDHKSTDRKVFERVHQAGGRISANRIHGILAPGRSLGDYNVIGNNHDPEIKSYVINPEKDMWIIIACDGLFDVLSNQRIAQFARSSRSASELAFDLRNLAYSYMSLDNISVIIIDVQKRFRIEEKILENQCNIDLNQERINDKNEGYVKEDMLKKIVHIDDENIKDPIPETIIKSVFDEDETNQEKINDNNDNINVQNPTEMKVISSSILVPDENFTPIMKDYPPTMLRGINEDDDFSIERKIRNSSLNSQVMPKMSSSVSMPSLNPDNLADPIIKIQNKIAKRAKDSKLMNRDIGTGSSDDDDDDL